MLTRNLNGVWKSYDYHCTANRAMRTWRYSYRADPRKAAALADNVAAHLVVGMSRPHDWSLDHRWVRWWEMRPILDAQTWLHVSQLNPQSSDSWRPVLRWTRLSWSDSIRRRSKSDTCFLNEDRQDDLSAVRFSCSLGDNAGKSQALMFVFRE